MGIEEGGEEEQNRIKWRIYRQIPALKQRVLMLYGELSEKSIPWTDHIWAEVKAMIEALYKFAQIFGIMHQIEEKREKIDKIASAEETTQRELLLMYLFELLEYMENYIGARAKRCNVCNRDVFFTPIPAGYEILRKRYGFLHWNADFQLESRENYGCPICEAYDRDRLMIAFLEEVKAENGEKLRMLQIAPSPAIEKYAQGREDIWYESTDLMMQNVSFRADLQHMDMVEDETYDIIVCSHVLEHVKNDLQAMKELHRMLKPNGVCLVLVPLIVGRMDTEEQWGCSPEENWRRFGQGDHSRLYGKRDFIRRLQSVGFYVNELGKEWFGEEFYEEYGFDDLSVMYVATKAFPLKL